MSPMAAIDAEHALRLANERLDGYRAEAAANRAAPAPARNAFRRLRELVVAAGLALRETAADRPAAQLRNYPYART